MPAVAIVRLPVQRTEKLSALTSGSGLPPPQLKLTCASWRTSTGAPARAVLLKYSARNPATRLPAVPGPVDCSRSLPSPPVSVSAPPPPYSVSLPVPPPRVSLPVLPVMTLFSALPVVLCATPLVNTRFSSVLLLAKGAQVARVVSTVSLPEPPVTASALSSTTKVSLPPLPTSVSAPAPPSSRLLPALPVTTLASSLPKALMAPDPSSVMFSTLADRR